MNISEKVKHYLDSKEHKSGANPEHSSKRSAEEKPNPKKEWNHLKADLIEEKVELVERLAKEYGKPVAQSNASTCSYSTCSASTSSSSLPVEKK